MSLFLKKLSSFCKFKFYITLLALGFAASTAHAQEVRLLYISTLPEIIKNKGQPGLAEVATIVRAEREKSDNVIFVHGGASIGPSVLGALDRGAHMIDILNLIEPDLMAVGKREFSYDNDQYTVHAQSASFPFISSNMVSQEDRSLLEATEADIIIELEGMNVGFIALTSHNVVFQYAVQNIEMLATDLVVKQKAAALRKRGADAIVLLADLDFNDFSKFTADQTVDAIFYVDSLGSPYSADAGGKTLTAGALSGQMIALTLHKSADSKISSRAELIDMASFPPDPEAKKLIESYSNRLSILLKQKIGTVSVAFNTNLADVRHNENAFGNLVADAMREAMQAEVAFLNSGGIRGNKTYAAGKILTREDIQLELPFNNLVELIEVSGLQLMQALEHGLNCAANLDGCFLQVSNINLTYDLSKPIGSRIISVNIAGKPVKAEQLYRLSTLDFLAKGGDGFKMLEGSPRLTQRGAGRLLWEVVAAHLQKSNTIMPHLDGRLISIPARDNPVTESPANDTGKHK